MVMMVTWLVLGYIWHWRSRVDVSSCSLYSPFHTRTPLPFVQSKHICVYIYMDIFIYTFLYFLLPLCYIPPFHCRGVSLIGYLFMKLNSWPDEAVAFLSRLSSHWPDGRGQFPNGVVWWKHSTPLAVFVFCMSSFWGVRRVRLSWKSRRSVTAHSDWWSVLSIDEELCLGVWAAWFGGREWNLLR